MRRNSKKGAIELGMNTIIIVVIGITLLSLSLVWIRGMMTKLGTTTGSAFDQTDTAIQDIYQGSTDAISIVPVTIEVKKDGSDDAKIAVKNFVDTDYKNMQFTINEASEGKAKVSCMFSENFKTTISKNIASGKGLTIPMTIKDVGTAIGTASCTVSASELDETATVVVKITS